MGAGRQVRLGGKGVQMKYSEEELEHINAVLTSKFGAAWAETAKVERIVSVRRVSLDERTSARRHEVIWEGPKDIAARLEGVDLESASAVSNQRAICLDVVSESLQAQIRGVMDRWAQQSRTYPIVSVQLAIERVAEVRLRGSRKVVLVGMRAGRLLAFYERRGLLAAASMASIAGLGVGVTLLAAQQSNLSALTAGIAVVLAVTITDALRISRTVVPYASRRPSSFILVWRLLREIFRMRAVCVTLPPVLSKARTMSSRSRREVASRTASFNPAPSSAAAAARSA